MIILLTLHSILRWIIIAVALVAIVKFALGWRNKQAFDKMANGLSAGFNGLMDLQTTLGLLYLLSAGFTGQGFPIFRIEHTITMILAVIVAHTSGMWKKKDDTTRYRNTLFTIICALLIVIIGVSALPGNRWLQIVGLF